jgi:hypothetical protein
MGRRLLILLMIMSSSASALHLEALSLFGAGLAVFKKDK